MTFTGAILQSVKSRAAQQAVDREPSAGIVACNILILRPGASIFDGYVLQKADMQLAAVGA